MTCVLRLQFIALWALLFSEYLSAKQPIRLGYIEFPPVFATNSDGRPDGVLIDLAAMVLSRAGYEWTAHSRPAKRMAIEIVKGDLDLWIGLATLPEFTNTTIISDQVVWKIELNAYWLGDLEPILVKEDLIGKKVIALHGFSYGGWVNFIKDPANRILECLAFTHLQALNMLKQQRCDYLLNYTGPMDSLLKRTPVEGLRWQSISSLDAKFVVSLKTPGAKTVLLDLLTAYDEMLATGQWPPQ